MRILIAMMMTILRNQVLLIEISVNVVKLTTNETHEIPVFLVLGLFV